MKIPFMDLSGSFDRVYPEINEKLQYLIRNTRFIGGEEIKQFEKEFAAYTDSTYAAACSNGTDALIIALKILGIGHGDKVLIPAYTFIATAEAVLAVGAEVDFIDIDEDYYTLSPLSLKKYMESEKSKNVKCIIPVHIYGHMADMRKIRDIADEYKLKIIEDAAQAHGSSINGKQSGFYSDITAYSFYPGKNLGAFGDAGAITMENDELYKRAKMTIDHGRWNEKYIHSSIGCNKRMDTIQAAILRIKLKYLNEWNNKRIEIADKYSNKLKNGFMIPKKKAGVKHVYHIYALQIEDRENIIKQLKSRGVNAGIHYPLPLHRQPALKYLNYTNGSFPISENLAKKELSLPLWPEMNDEQIDYVVEQIKDVAK